MLPVSLITLNTKLDDDSLKIQSVLDAIQIMHREFVKSHCTGGNEVEVKLDGVIKNTKI